MKYFTLILFIAAGPIQASELLPPQRAMDPATNVRAKNEAPAGIDDLTFLRRIWLDLVGVVPDRSTVKRFLADSRTNKRSLEIDRLQASTLYVERWTTFFDDLFQTHVLIEDTGMYRNAFHDLLRSMVARNEPWNKMASRIISASGKGPALDTAMFFWTHEAVEESWRLDYLDDQTAWMTETLLGVQTRCISCHDGKYHLEKVNVGLSKMTRKQFWGMSAMLASTFFQAAYVEHEEEDEFGFFRGLELVDVDRAGFEMVDGELLETLGGEGPDDETIDRVPDGEYHADSKAGEGMRPPRSGGIVAPAYLFNGKGPENGETRREALARMLSADLQFSRNMVNRLWAHFFGSGFVEPLDGWDLARLDPKLAAANNSTVQPRNVPLMNWLSRWFVDNNYDLRALIRLMVNSKLYQWNYAEVEPGQGTLNAEDPWGFWRENNRVRRIEAEAAAESMYGILGLKPRWVIMGKPKQVFTSTWQLPDPAAPNPAALFYAESDRLRLDPEELGFASLHEMLFYMDTTQGFLTNMGRGEYYVSGTPRNNDSNIGNSLFLMNSYAANYWIDYWEELPLISELIFGLDDGTISAEQLITRLYRDILFRDPDSQELSLTKAHITNLAADRAVIDVTWALFNHPDFLYK